MSRRCVVCGKKSAENDSEYYCPRNDEEARIWQKSMDASGTSVESIKKCCCVCIEHIPQFVERARQQVANIKEKSGDEEDEEEISLKPETSKKSVREKPSVNVLLLPGVATVPCHCKKSNKNEIEGELSQEEEDSLDDEIYVKKSSYPFCAAPLADIDETEVTVLRTPMQTDDELHENHNKECGDNNCTDVLVLGQKNDKCLCKCEQCSKTMLIPNDIPKINNNLPSHGCDCDPKMLSELTQVIKQQQERINELETLLDRQNNWHFTLQRKMNELYTEFGRVERPQEISHSLHSTPSVDQSSQTRILAGSNVQWYSLRIPPTGQSETAITNNFQNSHVKTMAQPES